MRVHINGNIVRHFDCLYSYICQGIAILTSIRVKRHSRYHFIPVCYSIYLVSPRQKKIAACTLAVFFLVVMIGHKIFSRFYIYEADIKLIYLDDVEDMAREIYTQTANIEVSGWQYTNKLDNKDLMKTKPSNDIEFDNTNKGYWIFRDKNLNASDLNYIELSDFQFWRRHGVALALRFYAHDVAKIIVNFESSDGSTDSTVLNSVGKRRKNFNKLCTIFILPPFKGSVDKIRISGVASRNSFVIIDKILLAVSNENRGLHMLFTLQPQSWCFSGVGNNVLGLASESPP